MLICFFPWAGLLFLFNAIHSFRHPYLCFSQRFFWACSLHRKPSLLNREGFWLIAGLTLSYLTRYIGLTLFLGIIIFLLSAKRDALRIKRAIFTAGGFFDSGGLERNYTFISRVWPSHGGQLFLINPTPR